MKMRRTPFSALRARSMPRASCPKLFLTSQLKAVLSNNARKLLLATVIISTFQSLPAQDTLVNTTDVTCDGNSPCYPSMQTAIDNAQLEVHNNDVQNLDMEVVLWNPINATFGNLRADITNSIIIFI